MFNSVVLACLICVLLVKLLWLRAVAAWLLVAFDLSLVFALLFVIVGLLVLVACLVVVGSWLMCFCSGCRLLLGLFCVC